LAKTLQENFNGQKGTDGKKRDVVGLEKFLIVQTIYIYIISFFSWETKGLQKKNKKT